MGRNSGLADWSPFAFRVDVDTAAGREINLTEISKRGNHLVEKLDSTLTQFRITMAIVAGISVILGICGVALLIKSIHKK